jgi:hypothetical protein
MTWGAGMKYVGFGLVALIALGVSDNRAEGTVRAVTVIGPVQPRVATLANAAGVSIDILPTPQIEVGQKLAVKVSTKKPGYLILVDVDATGKVTQIYPNLHSMQIPQGASETANLLEPGRPVAVPDSRNPFAHFEFIAEPPAGQGMIVALLSAKPVQVVDLPDVPQDRLDSESAAEFLQKAAGELKIAPKDHKVALADPQWSFAATGYSIGP